MVAPSRGIHDELIVTLCRHIENAEAPPTLDELAEVAGLSPAHLQRVFKAVTGLTPRAYAKALRAERVRSGLASGAAVTTAYHEAGYGSSGRFYEEARALLGMTPSRYRQGGCGETIRHAVRPCSLGQVLVAMSDAGVCAVLLGDDPASLVDELARRFPAACLQPGTGEMDETVNLVIDVIDDFRQGVDLPLDIRGTVFQRRVWEVLRAIPPGHRLSYGEVASRLGAPQSSRAVAQACAANALAVLIPCHRVVRSDGGLSGYRWGVERKRTLLEREADAEGRTSRGPETGSAPQ